MPQLIRSIKRSTIFLTDSVHFIICVQDEYVSWQHAIEVAASAHTLESVGGTADREQCVIA